MNRKLIEELRDNPVKFARLCGFDLLTDLHNDWLKTMLTYTDDYTLVAHRGSYKTTCLSFALAMNCILRPNATSFFIRKTDDDVIEIITQCKKLLESELFQYIANEIYGVQLQLTTSSAYKIDTNLNTSNRGQVQLQGMGLNGSITGKHADYVYCDDITNVKDRFSRAERLQTIRQFQELQNIKNRGGRIFCSGTPWHKDDCLNTQMKNIHIWTVYDTDLITDEQQQHLRSSMTASLYAANYECKHIADSDAMFSSVKYADVEDASKIRNGISHLDAAYGGSDYTSYTVMNEAEDGFIYAYGKIWQQHVDKCLPEIKQLHDRLQAGLMFNETNGDKGYLADRLECDYGFYVKRYHEHTNKFVKIATYLKKDWERIRWLPDTDANYLNQICDYTVTAEHDDAPDSAASLLREMSTLSGSTINTSSILAGGIL